jgi:hypothetical protein
MNKIRKANEDLEIYIVSHSEGTVVAFLGLLTAAHRYQPPAGGREERYGWIKQVRGLMTIGSPIEEHLILWPELFQPFEARSASRYKPESPERRIRWRNYYDNGDPIAYRLVEAADWIERNKWDEVFEFDRSKHEFVFSRYPFPGKAHNDYWDDPEVFGHFIEDVVTRPPVEDRRFPKSPQSSWYIAFLSRVVPYLIPALLLFTGVFLLFRGVRTFLVPRADLIDTMAYTLWNVTGYWALFLGLTLAARIPRLTRSWWSWGASCAMFAAGLIVYYLGVDERNQRFLTDRVGVLTVVALVVVGVVQWVGILYPRLGPRR